MHQGGKWNVLVICYLLIRICRSFDLSPCTETFERYFGYHLSNNISNEFNLRNFSIENASTAFNSCRKACAEDATCQGFSIDLKRSQCFTYKSFYENEAKFFRVQLESQQESIFWRRTCLKTSLNCSFSWYFDIWPSFSIRSEKIDRFLPVSSMEQCQEACSSERKFQCRSAMYNYVTRNCHLSRHDKRSLAIYFSSGSDHEMYLENQCSNSVTTGCEFTLEESLAPIFWLNSASSKDAADCEQYCLHHGDFVCRSYGYSPHSRLCSIGPDDAFSFSRLEENKTTFERVPYFQRGECTNVRVICGSDEMVANFRADRAFDGRIVSLQAPKSCAFNIKEQFEFNVSFSLDQKSNCGLVDEEPNTVIAMVMMQYHDKVITAKDKALKLVCKYEIIGKTVSNFVELSEGGVGSNATVVTGGKRALPEAVMRIVNGDGQTVSSAEIGQTLYAEVTLKEAGKADIRQSDYSLFVNNCEALDEGQNVLLVDDSGCPSDTSLFEGFHPVQSGNSKVLRAAFQGFRFQTKRRVNINCNVNFCFRFCQPTLCTDKNGRRVMSLGRKKREVGFEEIVGQVRVESAFDIIDSRNIAVVISDQTSSRLESNFETASIFDQTLLWTLLFAVALALAIFLVICIYHKKNTLSRFRNEILCE